MHELRLALRRARSSPGFVVAAAITLALGIAANALVFSALRGLLLRDLPFPDADRLVWLFAGTPQSPGSDTISPEEADAVAARMRTVQHVGVIGDKSLVREQGPTHARWHGIWVTLGLIDVLRVRPALGRVFSADDLGAAPAPSMMIGYERWRTDFGADRGLIGRVLQFSDNKQFTVVGVLPPGLEFPFARSPHSGNGSGFRVGVQDFWVLGQDDARRLPAGVAVARLGGSATAADASVEAAALSTSLNQDRTRVSDRRSIVVVPMRDQVLGPLAPALPLLQGFAALVFVIACVNAATLVLARASAHATDIAVRTALGARPADLFRVAAADGAIIATVAYLAGMVLTFWGRDAIAVFVGGSPALLDRIQVDGVVLLAALTVSAVVAFLLGVLPGVAWPKASLSVSLSRGGTRQTFMSSRPALRVLVVAQMTLSVVLLLGAGLFRQSLQRLLQADAGYRIEGVVTADVLLYVRNPVPFFRHVYDRLHSLPEVEAVGLVQSTPLTGKWTMRDSMGIVRDGVVTETPPVAGGFVAFDYFEAMRIPVLAGRPFTEQEFLAPNSPAIIINDVAARQFFRESNPVGARVMLFGKSREVVGVVKGTRDVRLDAPPEPQWYQPMLFGGSQIVVRTAGRPAAFVETLRRELLAADSRVMIAAIEPLESIVADSVVERRVTTHLVTAFAAVALALAAVGLYSVMHVVVTRQTREFGVRLALGARPGHLAGMIVRQGGILTIAGIGAAAVTAVPLIRVVRNQLFDVTTLDPILLMMILLIVALVSLAACALPAWRAASADPLVALRAE